MQNLKSVALPVPGIIGGIRKNWAVPGYAHAPFSLKFLMGFCSDGPCECTENFQGAHIHRGRAHHAVISAIAQLSCLVLV